MSYAEDLQERADAVEDIEEDGSPALLRYDRAWGTQRLPDPVDVEVSVLMLTKQRRDASGLARSVSSCWIAAGALGDVPAPPESDPTPGAGSAWTIYPSTDGGVPDPDDATWAWRVVRCLETVWSGSVEVMYLLELERVAVASLAVATTPQPSGAQNVYEAVFASHAIVPPYPVAFRWSSGTPVAVTAPSANPAVGVVVGVDPGNAYRLTLATDGAIVDVSGGHGLGSTGPRWLNSAGAIVSTEPVGVAQLVLEVVSATRYHVTIGAVTA